MPKYKECICEPNKPMHNTACECPCHMVDAEGGTVKESQFQINDAELNEFIDNPKESGE
jgi:hypothetical protein